MQGMDELTPMGTADVVEATQGDIRRYTLEPKDLGIKRWAWVVLAQTSACLTAVHTSITCSSLSKRPHHVYTSRPASGYRASRHDARRRRLFPFFLFLFYFLRWQIPLQTFCKLLPGGMQLLCKS